MRTALCWILAVPLLYLMGAVVGGLVPANGGWRMPPQGITIFVQTNGIHTSIVVPVRAAGIDWGRLIRPGQPGHAELSGDHLSFAWGHREFFLKTPTWSQLRADVAARALTGQGGSLLHVEHLSRPQPAPDQRPVLLTAAQYQRLNRFILASFRIGADGASVVLPGYGPSDFFYEARGRYSLFRTSNEWTGAALRRAGVRVGIWTPFSQSIMWRFG